MLEKYKFHIILLLFGAVFYLFFFTCSGSSVPSFYYWKTVWNITDHETKVLDSLNVKKIYTRFFDYDFSPEEGRNSFTGLIVFNSANIANYELVPVVYITNKALLSINPGQTLETAEIIYNKIKQTALGAGVKYKEIQLDCDWTERIKEKFFAIAAHIKSIGNKEGYIISSTIRLHQIKYSEKTGVPPVDRGMLMFYNMGTFSPDTNMCYLYDKNEAKKYLSRISSYPLPLDAALPIFSTAIHIRDGKPVNILPKSFTTVIDEKKMFTRASAKFYRADSSFYTGGIYFMKNDLLKIEILSPEETLEAARMLAWNLNSGSRSITLFDLDINNLKRYNHEELAKIFNAF